MRLCSLATSALAAASFLASGVAAQDGYVTSVSTYTITRTVERVVETTWATLSSSAPATDLPHELTFSTPAISPVASASMAPLPHYNSTMPASGSGGLPSSTVTPLTQATGNAAPRTGGDSVAFAAIAGIIGLAVL